MCVSRLPRLENPPASLADIDALGWTTGLAIECFGVRIGIRTSDDSLLELLLPRLPPGWSPRVDPDVDTLYSLWIGGASAARAGYTDGCLDLHRLFRDAEQIGASADLGDILEQLSSALHFSVAIGARDALFVHAGVVGWRGRAIVMPGVSHSGKTDLVAALVRAGATYYSDEFAVFDAQGQVHPYPKALSLRPATGGCRRHIAVEQLGGRRGDAPLAVGLIAVTTYQPAGRWNPTPLSPGEAALALLEHTVLARSRPTLALSTLARTVSGATALRGLRGEADEVTTELLEHVGAGVPALTSGPTAA